jgi:hypothetical protein
MTVKFYIGAMSLEFEHKMPVFEGIGFRFNIRIYGKKYYRFKRKKGKEKSASRRPPYQDLIFLQPSTFSLKT